MPVNVYDLPTLNAVLNTICGTFLLLGYHAIRRHDRARHRRHMLCAVAVSALFFVSYVIYHLQAGSVPYPLHDWTRTLYFVILLPHIVLAAVVAPCVLILLFHAFRGRFDRHARLARLVWPAWIFVSVSGVAVYLMLYQWAGAIASQGN
ncbi:MAG: DUF420 domain-containing protein [Gemmatimonadetes bacterium]|jgi:putative membrane protein|nr:DUF420 domain-containing protein [Gemmatimonadota bacterium]MBT6145398.1 DUF420 domain-containing protein [Gemmatimonadota bacterium]MBT7860089.1 DUF420 domain-containing protein [Gemmatimonadota bacterium]